MLLLDNVRKEFSDFLANDPQGRWRMDAALTHVAKYAYLKGIADARCEGNITGVEGETIVH